jgi:hypothetical protein
VLSRVAVKKPPGAQNTVQEKGFLGSTAPMGGILSTSGVESCDGTSFARSIELEVEMVALADNQQV